MCWHLLSAFCITLSAARELRAIDSKQSKLGDNSPWSIEPVEQIGHALEETQPVLLSADVDHSKFEGVDEHAWIMGIEKMQRIGHSLYATKSRDQPTWESLFKQTTGFGMKCHPGSDNPCGQHGLICRNRMCRECRRSADCPMHHVCRHGDGIEEVRMCIKKKTPIWEEAFAPGGHWLLIGTVLIFCSAILAATAGVGGGGIFVPLLIICCSKSPSQAVPIAQAMIFTGSIINLVSFITQRHPQISSYPVIDYNCIALLEPLLCTGVVLGVIAGQACPSWFLVFLLGVTLIPAISRTGQKGRKQWEEEKERDERGRSASNASNASSDRGELRERRTCFSWLCSVLAAPFQFNYKAWSESHIESFLGILKNHYRAMLMVVVVWITIFVVFMLWGKNLSVCSYSYLIFLTIAIGGFILLTFLIGRYVVKQKKSEITDPIEAEKAVDWGSAAVKYPIVGMIAGFLGGLLGLGGGVIMSPVLLELGMHSEAVQATTATFVFISSSVATIQFIMLRVYLLEEVAWYCACTFIATALGQWVFGAWIRKTKRYSLITLSIAGILLLSLIFLTLIGSLQTYEDYTTEGAMDFKFEKICGSGTQSTIVTNSRAEAR